MSDADRAVWNEMQRDGAPQIVHLADRRIKHARIEHVLACGCVVKVGESYRWQAWLADGVFERMKMHAFGLCEGVAAEKGK